ERAKALIAEEGLASARERASVVEAQLRRSLDERDAVLARLEGSIEQLRRQVAEARSHAEAEARRAGQLELAMQHLQEKAAEDARRRDDAAAAQAGSLREHETKLRDLGVQLLEREQAARNALRQVEHL